jgi:hypothetical protein
MSGTSSRQLWLLGLVGLLLLTSVWARAQSTSVAPAITVYADPT